MQGPRPASDLNERLRVKGAGCRDLGPVFRVKISSVRVKGAGSQARIGLVPAFLGLSYVGQRCRR